MNAWACESHIYLNGDYVSGETVAICKDKKTAIEKCEEHFFDNTEDYWKMEADGFVPFYKVKKGFYSSVYLLVRKPKGAKYKSDYEKMQRVYSVIKMKID